MKRFVQMASFDAKLLFILHFICSTLSAPQQPEINDQFTSNATSDVETPTNETRNKEDTTAFPTKTQSNTEVVEPKNETPEATKPTETRKYLRETADVVPRPNFLDTIYEVLTKPISNFLSSPKVSFVLSNVGTCLVNGAMEIISHYLPAPLIPLIASAAGMVIPFEPVVMLKERMPVTSYRRAFNKAMNSFLNTFDGYKFDNFNDDPYMTRRFNRRFMNGISDEKEKKSNDFD